MRVLFVDDDSSVLRQAEIFLEDEDDRLDIETAVSVEEGLELLDDDKFDAIVSDYQMHGVNGLDFLETVREGRNSNIPFIIFTGKGREEVAMDALNLGANRYLQKRGDPKSQFKVLAQAIVQEIEHLKASRRLEEVEGMYQVVTENSPNGIYVFQDGNLKFVNETLLEMSGYSREELKKIDFFDLVHPDYREKVKEWTEQAFKGDISNIPRFPEFKALRKDGSSFWIKINPSIIEYNEKTAIIGNVADITERKEKEQKIRESEREKSLILESTDEIIAYHDTDHNILWANKAYREAVGLSSEELEGKKCYHAWGVNAPCDNCPVSEALETGESTVAESTPDSLELWFPDEGYWRVKASPVEDDDGKIIGAVEVTSDITEHIERKKELEDLERREDRLTKGVEKYRKLSEASPDSILLVNAESGEVMDANVKVEDLFKLPRKEVIGAKLSEFYPEEEANSYKSLFMAGEDKDKSADVERSELHVVDKEGNKIPVEIGTSELELMGQKVVYGAFRNIEERKEAENREEFLHSLLRHDLRNKLTVVSGYLDLIDDYDLPEEVKRYISKVKKGSEEGSNIIEKVRTLRQAEEEKVEEVKINPVIQEVVEQAEDLADEKGITIETELPEEDYKVLGGVLLNQAFSNIIENAIQHSGGSKIHLRRKITEKEIIYIIEDDGKGIPDEKKDKIFNKGYTSDEARGSGLGTFLVKSILNVYGASIEVKDSELGGARFDVHLQKA